MILGGHDICALVISAIVGGAGKYEGARGEDVVPHKGAQMYFTLTLNLPE